MGKDIHRIIAWQKADDLVVEVYRASESHFSRAEQFGLTAQLRSAAVSVAANIAEGSGGSNTKEFRRFLYYAQGSLSEVEYYLHLTRRLGYLSEGLVAPLERLRSETGRTLYGLINALESSHSHD